jgi:protein-S-isoprenylcysteine O-methyltransferase Ste14
MNYLFAAASGICFAVFAWSVARVFRKPQGAPLKMHLLSLSATICWLVQLWVMLQRPMLLAAAVAGLIFYMLSLLLFFSALKIAAAHRFNVAFTATEPERIVKEGPYAFIRHPLYSAYLLFWMGGAVATLSLVAAATVILMFAVYRAAIKQEELEFAAGSNAAEYANYKKSAGVLMPRIAARF